MTLMDPGSSGVRVVPAGTAALLETGPRSRMQFVAPGSEVDGRFGLFRLEMDARAAGARPHLHRTFAESFFVLAGSVSFHDGARWVRSEANDFVYVPEHAVHGFRNDTDRPASMLILFTPGAPRERYFEELAELHRTGRTLSPDEWADLYARHDQVLA